MLILKKQGQKDYYDFMEQVYGIDKLVVYDRRKSFPIDPNKNWGSAFMNSNVEKWFRKEPIFEDKKRKVVKYWNAKKILKQKENEESSENVSLARKLKYKKSLNDYKEGQVNHFVLEVGYYHYYFECERYLDDNDEKMVHLDYGLIDCIRVKKDERISDEPMCLAPCVYHKYTRFNRYEGKYTFTVGDREKNQVIENPILYNTYIAKLISPKDIWNQLYEYISSLRDKEFKDTRTNEQHIESNGFDKKISFRHRK